MNLQEHLVWIARSLVGSHYVWGGYGNTPGAADGVPGAFGRRVRLHENDPGDFDPRRRRYRRSPWLFAAYTRVTRLAVRGGRRAVPRMQALPVGDPNNLAHRLAPWDYRWPRPDDLDLGAVVFGESCAGRRHFDCTGLGNFVLWKALRWPVTFAIEQWIGNTSEVPLTALEPGDLLTAAHESSTGSRHIGIATGAGTVVHARGYRLGVMETPAAGAGTPWSRAGRLAERQWRSRP